MATNDDPLGDKLRKKEKVEEDRHFSARDKLLIEKIRREELAAGAQAPLNCCPRCGTTLSTVSHFGVSVDECPKGHGMWLSHGDVEKIASRERDSWLGRYFYRPKPVT